MAGSTEDGESARFQHALYVADHWLDRLPPFHRHLHGSLAICISIAPLSPKLALAVCFCSASWAQPVVVSGVAMNTSIMEMVPKHFMGRVQNTFYFAGTALQIVLGLIVGAVAEYNLVAGFAIIGIVYALAFVCSSWPVRMEPSNPA